MSSTPDDRCHQPLVTSPSVGLRSASGTVEGTNGTSRWGRPWQADEDELMSRVFVTMAMSLDGFITGPEDNAQNPAGTNGMRLMDWLGVDRSGESLEEDGGGGGEKWRPQDPFSQVVFDEMLATGAVI